MSKGRVLVVDDEVDLAELVAEILTENEFEVDVASGVDEALRLCVRFRPNVIVSDVRMPGRSGLDLLHAINASDRPVPVVLITGYCELSPEQLFESGAAALLPKPIDFDRLVECVDRAQQAVQADEGLRKSSRGRVDLPVRLSFSGNEGAERNGRILNLSRGGACFEIVGVEVRPSPGDVISFSFEDREGDLGYVIGTGVCRWSSGRRDDGAAAKLTFGLAFSQINPATFEDFFRHLVAAGSYPLGGAKTSWAASPSSDAS